MLSLRHAALLLAIGAMAALEIAACSNDDGPTQASASVSVSTGTGFDGGVGKLCALAGSRQYLPSGEVNVVAGAPSGTPDLSWLTLPPGYCAHYYGAVPYTRQIRFAPSGELFVASPTTCTTGGPLACGTACGGAGQQKCAGLASIMLLPDDDGDGFADSDITFLGGLPSTQGLLFANDHFYYQDGTQILRIPYTLGDRAPQMPSELVADVQIYKSGTHWPKTLDIADDGTIYVGNGGDQSEVCDPSRPFHGGVLALDGSAGGKPIVKGLRNPISVKCQKGHDQCYAVELALDYSAPEGGREKLLPIHEGDDWGFPCCATKDLAYPQVAPPPDCSAMASETGAFTIGETPFGFDFEPGKWPAPYTNGVFIPLHGVASSWAGARLVVLATDPTTGAPLPGSDLGGVSSGSLSDFAIGWDDGSHAHGRPSTIAFAADGRMFIGNDNDGSIIWIAPLGLD